MYRVCLCWLCCRLPEIYTHLRHTIDQSNADQDLHWWSQFRGVGMMMAWPTFEVSELFNIRRYFLLSPVRTTRVHGPSVASLVSPRVATDGVTIFFL